MAMLLSRNGNNSYAYIPHRAPPTVSSSARGLVNFSSWPNLLYKGCVGLGQRLCGPCLSKRSSFSSQSKHPAQNPTSLSPLPGVAEERCGVKWKVTALGHEGVNIEVQKPFFHMQLNDEIGDYRGKEWPQTRFFLSAFTLSPIQSIIIQS